MKKYSPKEIELKWQNYWEKIALFKAKRDKEKKKRYILSMFPYPSGSLHMGHVMNYTISDVIVRYSLMLGYNVLSPIGWDSFGLPAENAAIREGIHPSENIRLNIDKMKSQMHNAGWGFDWRREFATSNENYYKWTQWLFLKFYKTGLVEQKEAPVNWCPDCKTVLANEQVHDGFCERCASGVEQKHLKQWFFCMSKYSEKLLKNHNKLADWPERVIKMQQEWIGKSEGTQVKFNLEGFGEQIEIFTTRPDTLFGVTFMSVAPQHPLVEKLIQDLPNRDEILKQINKMIALGTSELEMVNREKEGIFTGKYAINPVNGDKVPIWIANFVLMSYGTGIIMAVPAHDQRDFEFAKKYKIPIKTVIQPKDKPLDPQSMVCAFIDDGVMVNSKDFSGRNNREAMPDLINWLCEKGYGKKATHFKLRDWLISRQRYWGAPIPIIYCEKCKTLPVPEDKLPIKLPENVEFKPSGESPLALCKDFINTTCPKCGGPAKRESDTMDTFVDSSWYYLRYPSSQYNEGPFLKSEINDWCPVDIYIGGIEHATMHLIYFRFFAMALKEMGFIDFEEPVKKLFCQGMVCKTAYYCEKDKWLSKNQTNNGSCNICKDPVRSEVTKMSKTKLNVVSPEEIIGKYGADTMRMYILADNPPDRDQVWNEEGVLGINRFLNRLWDTCLNVISSKDNLKEGVKIEDKSDKKLRYAAHYALKRCNQAFNENWQFNTAIARIMELLNTLRKESLTASNKTKYEAIEILLKLIAPISPHIAEELWELLGHANSIFKSPLPKIDQSALNKDSIKVVVQINGKLRGNFETQIDTPKEELEKLAYKLEKIQRYIEGKIVRKVIVVPNKLVNIVIQ